jgi:hypothetical protein
MTKKDNEWTWFKHCDSFRKGKFQDAMEEVKKGWVIVGDNILQWVNRKWSDKMVKSNRLVSDCVTVSDKAFAVLIAKENLNYWIAKGMTKGVQHGNTKYSAVACVCNANSKTDENSDDEVELMKNDSNVNDNVVGNEEDEAAAIDSEKLANSFYCVPSLKNCGLRTKTTPGITALKMQ